MKKRTILEQGFTLVELLIVIALIAILSVAVLATINPIEQTNKARDAKFKNDSAEVLSSYERYYASQNAYPWNTDNDASGIINGDEVPLGTNGIAFLSTDWRFGVKEGTLDTGPLISTSELKSAFGEKEPFASTIVAGSEDAMYVFHSNDSNYVCFCPKANANRTGTVATSLKCLSGVTAGTISVGAGGNSTLSDIGQNGCAAAVDAKATTFCALGNAANLLCVPEGKISQ
jgi:prepilin-type N-terminal cleavage/methylation domain-containing protein